MPYTAAIIGLGSLCYFTQPGFCGVFVGGYLSILTIDLAKSLCVLKFDISPPWQSRTGDIAYLTTAALATTVAVGLMGAGASRLK